MALGTIIILLFIILIYFFEFFRYVNFVKLISIVLGVIFFYLFLFNVTSNNDWENYEYMFNGDALSSDFLFEFISTFFSSVGKDFQAVYQFHILLMGFGFIFFVSRFSKHIVFAVIALYLIFQLIPLSNQIRYFVAIAFFLLSIYEFIVTKNNFFFFIFGTISVLSHKGILLMYPFLLIYRIGNEKLIKRLIIYSLILSGVFLIIYRIGVTLFSQFTQYFHEKMLSSFSGGVFNNLILLIWILLIIYNHKKLINLNKSEIESDVKYMLLYKLSVFTIIFLPTSIFLQVIGFRYIASLFIVWLTFFLYCLKFYTEIKQRIQHLTIILFLSIFTFVYLYILPELILNILNFEIVLDLIESNTLLNSL